MELGLGNNYIENINGLADGLRYNSSLTEINLNCNRFETIGTLVDELRHNDTLKNLSLSSNSIKDLDYFIDALKINTTLENLCLYDSKFDIDRLVTVMEYNVTLTSMFIFNHSANYPYQSWRNIETRTDQNKNNNPNRRATLFGLLYKQLLA